MPCPSQSSRFNHSDYIRWTVQTMKFLIVEPSPFSSLLGPNIRLRILFSNIHSLDSSLNVRDHVSQPYSTTGNIIVLYILIFKFLERKNIIIIIINVGYLETGCMIQKTLHSFAFFFVLGIFWKGFHWKWIRSGLRLRFLRNCTYLCY